MVPAPSCLDVCHWLLLFNVVDATLRRSDGKA